MCFLTSECLIDKNVHYVSLGLNGGGVTIQHLEVKHRC